MRETLVFILECGWVVRMPGKVDEDNLNAGAAVIEYAAVENRITSVMLYYECKNCGPFIQVSNIGSEDYDWSDNETFLRFAKTSSVRFVRCDDVIDAVTPVCLPKFLKPIELQNVVYNVSRMTEAGDGIQQARRVVDFREETDGYAVNTRISLWNKDKSLAIEDLDDGNVDCYFEFVDAQRFFKFVSFYLMFGKFLTSETELVDFSVFGEKRKALFAVEFA